VKEAVYWLDTVRRAHSQHDSVQLPPRADVVVVGAGYTGLSAARRLAKAGATVVAIDAHDVGYGASSRNGGQVLTGLRIDPATLVARYGEPHARRLFDASIASLSHLQELIAAESIDCEYEQTGHIQAAWKPAHFRDLQQEQALLGRVFNHRVELVPQSDQRRELGSDAYHGVLVDDRSAALNPAQYVQGLAAAARRAGAIVVTGVSVERLSRGGSSSWTVTTTRGAIEGRDVMIATNGYTGAATPLLRKVWVPIGSYVIATAPLEQSVAKQLMPTRRMAFDSKHFLYYFRITADRRLLFGGRALFTTADRNTTQRAATILRRGMNRIFPELATVSIDYAWGGQVCFARDERPHAGRLGDGTYFAGAYAGHGIAMATMLGDLTARRIAGERVEHPFMDDNSPPIPFYNGRPWFLPLIGAYYQVKDWIS
jgi:glycine/D-amino acid oxidase-like deaminating enzyme